ncbi:LEM domain-containing protein 1 isoform X1 [Mauremys mutica]|uniref:LEM domain-containing protein 1 isoform X1 n=1 Tax=Mauremys mutica TaxID=74926 RepID=UPI001D166078|nr:LEM domain-containing protein 1 isoform X1 [Mauremys mutica]XP_044869891.1 LEM domain-containing protein 1 isoform X1 [Mauremys mutica]XP_044869892.1 LEM domain-containing protein 1 isoform X1 [Mauremys mutica]XP_044869893.1 LEM domain-containing protein 1 isoform X1 [Mauremys mutica]
MAQVTVGVLIEKQEQENRDQDTTDEISIKLLSDNELQEKLLMYGTEPGPILPSTRTLYENKLLQLVNPSPQGLRAKPKESGDLDQSSESEEEKETSTEVVLETKDFKVTAACATGYSKAPHTEFSERHKKLLAPDADYSLAKIVAELEQILPEDKLPAHRTQGQKRSGGSSPQASRRTKGKIMLDKSTMTYRTPANTPQASIFVKQSRLQAADTMGDSVSKDDGQGETWFPEPRSPIGISPRRRSVRESDPSTQNIVEKSKVEKEKPKASALEHKEAHRGILSMPIRIAILAIFVFVLFVYVTMETNPDNPFTNFITGRG